MTGGGKCGKLATIFGWALIDSFSNLDQLDSSINVHQRIQLIEAAG
jgi:hypothetical protein